MLNLSSIKRTILVFKARVFAVTSAIIIASCSAAPQPVLAQEPPRITQESFCDVAVGYNLNWLRMLQQGASVEDVVQGHLEVTSDKELQIPEVLLDVLNRLLYLTMLNRGLSENLVYNALMTECKKEMQKIQKLKPKGNGSKSFNI